MGNVYAKIKALGELAKSSETKELKSSFSEFYKYSVHIFDLFDKALAKNGIKDNNSVIPERNPILREITNIQNLLKEEKIDTRQILQLLDSIESRYCTLGCAMEDSYYD